MPLSILIKIFLAIHNKKKKTVLNKLSLEFPRNIERVCGSVNFLSRFLFYNYNKIGVTEIDFDVPEKVRFITSG